LKDKLGIAKAVIAKEGGAAARLWARCFDILPFCLDIAPTKQMKNAVLRRNCSKLCSVACLTALQALCILMVLWTKLRKFR
jgi:hypothetical protein